MVSKTVIIFAALCICQAIAKPSGDKQDNLQVLTTQIQSTFETFTDEFKKIFDIKETKESQEIANTLKTNANEFAGKLTEILAGAGKEIKAHSGDANNAIEALKTKVSETVKKLQEEHPTEAAKAKEYQKQIETTYNDLYAKAKDAAQAIAKDTSGIQEDLHKFTESIIKEAKANMDKINTDLKKSLEEHAKEHKH